MPDDVHLIKELQSLRTRRLLRTLAVVQDLSDALMAINDVTGTSPQRLQERKPCSCLFACMHSYLQLKLYTEQWSNVLVP